MNQQNKNSNALNKTGKVYTRPWGTYQTLAIDDEYQIKIITVNPEGRLSLQKHLHRSEHWVVVKGSPTITVGDEVKNYNVGDTIFIAKEMPHRLENFTNSPVIITEVQLGAYLGEDDIIRLDDVYGR